jgi:squalene cyclase
VPEDVIARLIAAQTQDGAWAFTGDTAAGAGDTNTTALVVQALIATGHRDAIGRALDYFRRTQNADAGWPYQIPSAYGTETDANSTANVIQALIAAGESLSDWSKAGRSDPLGALVTLQDDKTGALNYQASLPGANLLATLQAIPALKGATFVRVPVVSASGAASSVAAPPQTLPVAGAPFSMLPLMWVGIGAALVSAGWLMRRKA